MKNYILIAASLLMAACGATETSTVTANDTILNPLPAPLSVDALAFYRNDMPVDGSRVLVTLKKQENTKYKIELHTAHYDRFDAKLIEKTVELGRDMDCAVIKDTVCSHDDRPVDGVLNTITISQDDRGYNVDQTIKFWNRQTRDEEVINKSIASLLTQRNDLATHIPAWGTSQAVKFSRDDRPFDGDKVEVFLSRRGGNKYEATLHVANGGLRPDPQPEDHWESLAMSLECRNGFADEIGSLTDIICEYDGRAADGNLVVLRATLIDGGYNVSLISTPARAPLGSTIRELGTNLQLEVIE